MEFIWGVTDRTAHIRQTDTHAKCGKYDLWLAIPLADLRRGTRNCQKCWQRIIEEGKNHAS